MHLYQYLPGKFKATSNTSPQKLDVVDLQTKTTAKSSLTPRQQNLSVKKPIMTSSPHDNVDKVKQHHGGNDAFSPVVISPSPEKDTPRHYVDNNRQRGALPTNVGLSSSEVSVMSEVTTPTVLTYPKIGPGYSDCISVTSDLTIPTVMAGDSPIKQAQQRQRQQQQQQSDPLAISSKVNKILQQQQEYRRASSYTSHPMERATSAPPGKRHSSCNDMQLNNNSGSGSSRKVSFDQRIKQDLEAMQAKRSSSHRQRSRSRSKSSDKHKGQDKELTDRLDRLRMKSISGGPKVSGGTTDSGTKTKMMSSAPARLDVGRAADDDYDHRHSPPNMSSPTRVTSKKMEETLWATVQQLLDQEYQGDFEEEKSPKNNPTNQRRRAQCRSSSPRKERP